MFAEDFLWQHTQHQGRENLCQTMHPRAKPLSALGELSLQACSPHMK